MFLDTELTEGEYRSIADRVICSGYSPAEIHAKLWDEIYPAAECNIRLPAFQNPPTAPPPGERRQPESERARRRTSWSWLRVVVVTLLSRLALAISFALISIAIAFGLKALHR